jgi:hypothetical protein
MFPVSQAITVDANVTASFLQPIPLHARTQSGPEKGVKLIKLGVFNTEQT